MDPELKNQWQDVQKLVFKRFGENLSIDTLIYIIGLQELGKTNEKFSKQKKLEVMHIGVCTLLTPFGYYEFKGYDDDGWPHWELKKKLPVLNEEQQEILMKKAIIEYFKSK